MPVHTACTTTWNPRSMIGTISGGDDNDSSTAGIMGILERFGIAASMSMSMSLSYAVHM
jgi:hypothetical protein